MSFEVIQFNKNKEQEEPLIKWTVIFKDGTMREIEADIIDPEYLPFILFAKKFKDNKFDMVHSINFDEVKEIYTGK